MKTSLFKAGFLPLKTAIEDRIFWNNHAKLEETKRSSHMKSQFTNLITVFPVKDVETSLAWYRRWLGEPDSIPMEGLAEYQVTETAWLQLTQEEGNPTSLILGVDDINKVREDLVNKGLEPSDIMDWEVVLTCQIEDPDGHTISFAQEVI